MVIGIGGGITRRRRAVASGGGSGIPVEATPISNVSVARATTGNYVLNMAAGLTGATPWVFCSTPPIGATFPGDNTMVWPKNEMMIGLHEIILFAWNGSGLMERQRFTIDVTPPTILTECKFGVLTIAAAGKIDTNKIAGGPLTMGAYAGAWGSFTVDASGFMTPTLATLVAGSYTIGSLTTPVVIEAGYYSVANQTECKAALAAAGGSSGKTVKWRGHAATGNTIPYTVTTSPTSFQDIFNGIASLCTITCSDENDKPFLEKFSVFSGGAGTPNNLWLYKLGFSQITAMQDKSITNTIDNGLVVVQNGSTNITVSDNEFISNWYVGRIANQRPTTRRYAVEVSAGVGTIVEHNKFQNLFSPLSFGDSAYGCIYRFNTAHMIFDDTWFNTSTDTAGPTYAGCQMYGNYTAHMIGDSGFHADMGGHLSPQRANQHATNEAVYGNMTLGGWEKLRGYVWATVANMPAATTIQTAANYSPAALIKFKAEMNPGVGNTITLTLPTLTGFGPAWATATAYVANDIVRQGGNFYRCTTNHTSSAAFATDLATKWSEALSCVQKMYVGGTVNVVVADGSAMAYTNHGNPTSISMVSEGMFFRLTPNSTTNTWGVNQEWRNTQGMFIEGPITSGTFRHVNIKLQHNIFYCETKWLDLRNQTNASVLGNWVPPLLPGDMYNLGSSNDYLNGIDTADDHNGILNGSGYRFMGNGPGPIDVNGSRVFPDAANNPFWNTGAGKTYAALTAQVQATSAYLGNRPNVYCPMTIAEGILCARPVNGSTHYNSGAGPMLNDTAAGDGFKFDGVGARNPAAWGRVDAKPWKVVGFNLVETAGGFHATWNEPAFIEDGAITSYKLEYRVNAGAWVDLVVGTALVGQWVAGSAGNAVDVRVSAQNANGYGPTVDWPQFTVARVSSANVPTFTTLLNQNFASAGLTKTTNAFTPSGNWPLLIVVHPRQGASYGSGVTTGPVVNSVTHSVGAGTLQSGPAKNRDSQRAGVAFFCFPSPTAVSQTIAITYNLSQTTDHIEVYEVVNGYTADLFGNTTFGQGSSNSRALSLAQTENVNSAVIAALCAETASATATITGSEFTPATDFLNSVTRIRDSFKTAATIGTYAETFTISATTQNVGVIVEINGA